ncbi:flagellar hook-length control protein FliK, partial [uncultured Pseudacidovorax sp.]|uniref:flagellar hook-length control protein FliK n=1 Tax=uncultured Pseudacidovorax sp. TaxID=679313 RepID=UPI0025E21086
ESRGKVAVDVQQPTDAADATPPDLALMLSQLMQKADGSGTAPAEAVGAGASGIEVLGARRPAAPGPDVRGRSGAIVAAAADAPTAEVPAADPTLANLQARPAVAPAVAPPLPGGRPATLPVVQTPAEAASAAGTATWQTRMLGQALGDHRPVPEVGRAPHPVVTPTPPTTTPSLAAQEAQAPSQAAALHAPTQVVVPAADAGSAQPVPNAATLSPDFASAWQRVEQPDDDGPSAGSGATIPGGWQAPGAPDLGATLPVLSPSATAEAGMAFRDASEALFDQVSWWAAQQAQGAQLTVAGPGDAPVSVQVRLQGQEAQVLFQTDDRQARQLIHQSLPQLEQMLAGQGLSLGSASVGTAPGQGGGQGLGAQAQAQGQGSSGQGAEHRDGRAAAAPAIRVASAGQPGAPGRGALDLFV